MDLVSVSKEEVIERARAWAAMVSHPDSFMAGLSKPESQELLAAVVLLEAREAMVATAHLDNPAATFAS